MWTSRLCGESLSQQCLLTWTRYVGAHRRRRPTGLPFMTLDAEQHL